MPRSGLSLPDSEQQSGMFMLWIWMIGYPAYLPGWCGYVAALKGHCSICLVYQKNWRSQVILAWSSFRSLTQEQFWAEMKVFADASYFRKAWMVLNCNLLWFRSWIEEWKTDVMGRINKYDKKGVIMSSFSFNRTSFISEYSVSLSFTILVSFTGFSVSMQIIFFFVCWDRMIAC